MLDFNKTWIFLIDFEKISNVKFYQNLSSGSRVVPCGQRYRRTDMKIVFAFRVFCEKLVVLKITFYSIVECLSCKNCWRAYNGGIDDNSIVCEECFSKFREWATNFHQQISLRWRKRACDVALSRTLTVASNGRLPTQYCTWAFCLYVRLQNCKVSDVCRKNSLTLIYSFLLLYLTVTLRFLFPFPRIFRCSLCFLHFLSFFSLLLCIRKGEPAQNSSLWITVTVPGDAEARASLPYLHKASREISES